MFHTTHEAILLRPGLLIPYSADVTKAFGSPLFHTAFNRHLHSPYIAVSPDKPVRSLHYQPYIPSIHIFLDHTRTTDKYGCAHMYIGYSRSRMKRAVKLDRVSFVFSNSYTCSLLSGLLVALLQAIAPSFSHVE